MITRRNRLRGGEPHHPLSSLRRRQAPPPSTATSRSQSRTSNSQADYSTFIPSIVLHPCTSLASFFSHLGTLLSTHQVLSLLLTALVICSLLSPSLLVYFAPTSSTTLANKSPLAKRGRGELMWELEGLRRQGVIASEEEVCWDRVKKYYHQTGREGGGRRIRVEQVLVALKKDVVPNFGTAAGDGGGIATGLTGAALGTGTGAATTITKELLHDTWEIQSEIERRLLELEVPGNGCLRSSTSPENRSCAILSPLGWWQDRQALLQDEDVHETLSNPPPYLQFEGSPPPAFPLTISETFVGAQRDRQGLVKSAQHLILTFFLEDVPSHRSARSLQLMNSTSMALDQEVEDAARERARREWRKVVRDVVGGKQKDEVVEGTAIAARTGSRGVVSESKGNTRHVLLKFLPHLVVDAHPRRLENIIYAFGYLLVIIYVSRYIRRLRAHSKMGLIITGIAELCSSGIMSVSICYLMGWQLGLVPWNLMAFLILTSGLDNMILVLRAIASTDLNLPVPERMAVGLKFVGVEMTVLLLVEELIAAWLLWFVEITVMRQWIRFGAVVLAVDYFLELTFFSTVLSIDIQRLELADLLAHNTSTDSVPSASALISSSAMNASQSGTSSRSSKGGSSNQTPQKTFKGFVRGSWKVLKDRPAKTSTVAFLWVINVLLWAFYGSEHYLPATCSQTALSSDRPFLAPSLDPSLSRALRLGQADPSAASHLSVPLGSGETMWSVLNPSNASSVQVYLEPTVSIRLYDFEASDMEEQARNRSPAPESVQFGSLSASSLSAGTSISGGGGEEEGPGIWAKLLIVVVPIGIVMGLLRLLLVYLLKDAELLQARWGSEERVSRNEKDGMKEERGGDRAQVEVVVGIEPTTKQHAGDVELIASGGSVIVSWAGLEEEVQVRRRSDLPYLPTSTSTPRPSLDQRTRSNDSFDSVSFSTRLHIPLAAEPISLTSLAVDPEGKFCAASTNRGKILVWALERGGTLVDFGAETPNPSQVLGLTAIGPSRLTEGRRGSEFKKGEAPAPPTTSTFVGANGTKAKSTGPTFYSLHVGGQVIKWDCGSCSADVVVEENATDDIAKVSLVSPTNQIPGSPSLFLSKTTRDGRLQLLQLDGSSSAQNSVVFDLDCDDGATVLAVASFSVVSPLVGLTTLQPIVAVSSKSTAVSFYTLSPLPVNIASLPDFGSPVRKIRLTAAPTDSTCPSCLEPIRDGFLASVSTRSTFKVFRLFTPPTPSSFEPCLCNSVSIDSVDGARSRASSLGVVGSPVMTRVLSNGASVGRRGSPRKKPVTPTRPVAFGSTSTIPSSNDAKSTSTFLSPNGSNELTPTKERKSSFSNGNLLGSAPPPPKRSPSSTSLEGSTSSPSSKSSPGSPSEESGPPQLRVIEVSSMSLDDRGSWEVGEDSVVGLRRRKGEEGGGRGWEVWTLSLGRNGARLDEGYREGVTALSELLDDLLTREDSERPPVYPPSPSTYSRHSALRRRNVPLTALPSHSSRTFASAFLPFSRTGPIVSAFSSSSVVVGLGNQYITLSILPTPSLKDTIY